MSTFQIVENSRKVENNRKVNFSTIEIVEKTKHVVQSVLGYEFSVQEKILLSCGDHHCWLE